MKKKQRTKTCSLQVRMFGRHSCGLHERVMADRKCTRRSWNARTAWAPLQRGEAQHCETVHEAACDASAPLLLPPALLMPLQRMPLAQCLERRSGLPRLGAALGDGIAAGAEPLRVCYLGGSVTEQKAGWRPRVTRWLEERLSQSGLPAAVATDGRSSVCEVPAFCGNAGSKLLSFLVRDWVISRRPDLLFIEFVINDGDTLLETDDETAVGAAHEGIVRHVRCALPECEICLVSMFVRDDLPLKLRTGAKMATLAHSNQRHPPSSS